MSHSSFFIPLQQIFEVNKGLNNYYKKYHAGEFKANRWIAYEKLKHCLLIAKCVFSDRRFQVR